MKSRKNKLIVLLICLLIGLGWFYLLMPDKLFVVPYSTVVNSKSGQLLNARIAADGQWRFPPSDSLSTKFVKALLTYEDEHFYDHSGVRFQSIARALKQNYEAGKVVSGGSTLTMQLARMSRGNQSRNYLQKFIEVFLALRIEWSMTKDQILKSYSAHAPFGGNVVGLEAASWRYFGRASTEISWAEAAMLAVLPNAPGIIHPSKNRSNLLEKRNWLLKKLYENGELDEESYRLSTLEELPAKPLPIPQMANHFLNFLVNQEGPEKTFQSTLNYSLQKNVNYATRHFHETERLKNIHNLGVVVVDNRTLEIVAYVGNSPAGNDHQQNVDNVRARRSTGSIIKPLLFAECLQKGTFLPTQLVKDYPIRFGSYSPTNYFKTFDGAVPFDEAIARSLNVPAVNVLKEYGEGVFLNDLRELGFSTFNHSASHYGLTLILGGGEVTLIELGEVYANMAHELAFFPQPTTWKSLVSHSTESQSEKPSPISPGNIYHMIKAMQKVILPDDRKYFQLVDHRKIAWKTGTSFGARDSWAVGISPKYTVAVWVGNSNGEGVSGLSGLTDAAPLMFKVIDEIPDFVGEFYPPYDVMYEVEVCSQSGLLAGGLCQHTEKMDVSNTIQYAEKCHYCQQIWVDTQGHRVSKSCDVLANSEYRFVLPNRMEWYYSPLHPNYKPMPDWREDCRPIENQGLDKLSFLYPQNNDEIVLSDHSQKIVVQAVYRKRDEPLFWYLNNEFIGETNSYHEMAISPERGNQLITIMDSKGNKRSLFFVVK